jgi:YidC/Oxa1 family membrane protein insertase
MWDTLILNPMINALLWIYGLLSQNFGLAIIMFTIIVRLVTVPLTLQQQRSQQKMQELQGSKRWQDIQKKYKGDKQKLQEEQLKVYKEVGFNPLSGCLPTLIQLPIIFGLYGAIIRALASTPGQLLGLSNHMYPQTPKILIPLNSEFLWMDLAAPERLYLPFLSFGIPVLTILVVITTYMQSKLTTPVTPDSQGSQMTQMMSLYMPLLLGYFSFTFPAGLALYFVTSNVLAIVQYSFTGKIDWGNMFRFSLGAPRAK